eukprot:m51a1_g7973 putative camp-dependent protein kinase (396) ;mRNA; f:34924-36554
MTNEGPISYWAPCCTCLDLAPDVDASMSSLDVSALFAGDAAGANPTREFAATHATAQLSGATDHAPKMALHDFEAVKTIGTGTFGIVYLVQHRPTSKYYAMKVLRKADVVRMRQVEHILAERTNLLPLSHPFIVHLYCTFQDDSRLYMVMDYIVGGELFWHLRRAGRFSHDTAKFYTAEMVLALEYLHSQNIIYRDMKPENILVYSAHFSADLDQDGHAKLTDFGFSKVVLDRTWTLCGTPEYLAPEVIRGSGHGRSADWWSLGVLVYEMICGFPPFRSGETVYETYERILECNLGFPRFVSAQAVDLIRRLLNPDRSRRLGGGRGGSADVRAHAWFADVDWEAVLQRRAEPPIRPRVRHAGDTGNFESYEAVPVASFSGTASYRDLFDGLFTDF